MSYRPHLKDPESSKVPDKYRKELVVGPDDVFRRYPFGEQVTLAGDERRIHRVGVVEVAGIEPVTPPKGLMWLDTATVGPSTPVGVRVVDTVTGDTTLTTSQDYILVNASGGAVTITLPASADRKGKQFDIKKIDSSANTVTVDPDGSETIDDGLTAVLTSQYERITIVNDGFNWHI